MRGKSRQDGVMRRRDAKRILSYGKTEERGPGPRTRGRREFCVRFRVKVDAPEARTKAERDDEVLV